MNGKRYPQIVHTWMYGDVEFASVVKSLREVGADGADLGITYQGMKNNAAALEKIDVKGLLAAENMRVHAVTPLYNNPDIDLSHPEDRVRRNGVDFALRGLDLTARAGCDRMMVPPSWFSVKQTLHTTYEEDFSRSAESLARIASEAGKRSILLLIEPINRFRVSLVHTIAEARRMIKTVGMPNLGIAGDTYHFTLEEGRSAASVILEAGAMLRCLHIGENNRMPPGFGCLDWKSIILALKAVGFDGPLSHEPVYMYFDEKRVAADPSYYASFQKIVGHGIRHLNMAMEAAGEAP